VGRSGTEPLTDYLVQRSRPANSYSAMALAADRRRKRPGGRTQVERRPALAAPAEGQPTYFRDQLRGWGQAAAGETPHHPGHPGETSKAIQMSGCCWPRAYS